MQSIRNLAVAVIMALSFGVAHAAPVTLDHVGTSGIHGIELGDNKIGGQYPVSSSNLNMGQFTMKGPDGLFGAFCADIFHYIKGSGSYEAVSLSDGGLSDLQITRIAYLFDKYPVVGNTAEDNGLFQATLWEILFEDKPEGSSGWGISKGNFEIDNGLTKAQRKEIDDMIRDVTKNAGKKGHEVEKPLDFTYWKSLDGGQSLISWGPKDVPSNNVPEPSVLLLMLAGLISIVYFKRQAA